MLWGAFYFRKIFPPNFPGKKKLTKIANRLQIACFEFLALHVFPAKK